MRARPESEKKWGTGIFFVTAVKHGISSLQSAQSTRENPLQILGISPVTNSPGNASIPAFKDTAACGPAVLGPVRVSLVRLIGL